MTSDLDVQAEETAQLLAVDAAEPDPPKDWPREIKNRILNEVREWPEAYSSRETSDGTITFEVDERRFVLELREA